ncbi:MAG TPA: MGMT family protein [Candidatus Acidoferrales bacterium]|nr:MGMT family protein [Candidatus Acidoferrales bacterium]
MNILYVANVYEASGDDLSLEISTVKRNGVWFSAATDRQGKLVACAFSDRNRREVERAVRRSLPKKTSYGRGHQGGHGLRILASFYDGRGRASLSSVDLSFVSGFRRDVYKTLCKIPLGKVTTYGTIASQLGGKRYARAVGTAVATNPLPLIIPCHRVVPSSLKVGNYGMCGRNPTTGGYMKRMLLEREGVRFEGEKVAKHSIWVPR